MKILWFVSSLEQKGGGERFVLETVNAMRAAGHEALIACDRLSSAASFDGRYDLSFIRCLERDAPPKSRYLRRSFNKLRGTWELWRTARRFRPEIIICQSEYDAIKVMFVSWLLGCRYRVFVFGQMYQFRYELSKYARVFRGHLATVRDSRPGYRATIEIPPPRLRPAVYLVNEIASTLKYLALRRADRLFTLSGQVKWEVKLLYDREAIVARAAFDAAYIDEAAIRAPRPVGKPARILSVCRLVDKKRMDVIIRAFELAAMDAELYIVGAGPEQEKLQALAAQSTASGRIHFLGAVDDARVAREMAAADCFISMDIGDFDISVVEAMGKGKRIIVAQDFDLADFGPQFSGAIAVYPEPEPVAEAMRALRTMSGPGAGNLEPLNRLSWQWLAGECVR